MKTLILLRGLPGAGKTSLAKSLGGISIEADQYFIDENGEYKFDASKLANAHNYCQTQTAAWMNMSTDQLSTDTIVVSNTFTTEKEMEPYIDYAEMYSYRLVTLIVENRHGSESIHGVPKEVMEKMENRFAIKLR